MKKGLVSPKELKELYEKDFALWAELNAQLLREKAYEFVDWENLLEEIEDMGRSKLDACISYLAVIMEHLYKYEHLRHMVYGGRERGGRGWIKSIANSRLAIRSILRRNPSLKVKLPLELESAWEDAKDALRVWLELNGRKAEDFRIPEKCPYTFEQVMEYEPWKK